MSVSDNIVVDKELTPELIKLKQELDWGLGLELDRINLDPALAWPAKQKQSTEYKQKYENKWEKALTDAGYLVRPMFESIEKPSFEDWYEELTRIN